MESKQHTISIPKEYKEEYEKLKDKGLMTSSFAVYVKNAFYDKFTADKITINAHQEKELKNDNKKEPINNN